MCLEVLHLSEPTTPASSLENTPGVSLNNLKQHIKTLASDDFEGRGPLTLGIPGANLAHIYSHNDEEGILNITTAEYIIPLKKHRITHYKQERYFVIHEDSVQYLANYQGEVKGPFDSIRNNSGEFTGIKNNEKTKIIFD